MKKVLKFQFEGKEGFLSIIEKNDKYYALIQKDTHKVDYILKHNTLSISYELKTPVYQHVSVNLSFDKNLIEETYHQLEVEKNLYFKQLDDTLCVLIIEKEKE